LSVVLVRALSFSRPGDLRALRVEDTDEVRRGHERSMSTTAG
jgi:hypothetical protein